MRPPVVAGTIRQSRCRCEEASCAFRNERQSEGEQVSVAEEPEYLERHTGTTALGSSRIIVTQ